MESIFYLIKVSVCMAVCYLPYYLIFRKYTFFTINRVYLLLSLMFSLTIPAIHIQLKSPSPVISRVSISHFQLMSSGNRSTSGSVLKPTANQTVSTHWLFLCHLFYWVTTAALGIKLLFTLFHLMLKVKSKGSETDGLRYIYSTNGKNSSFFNLMFLDLSGLTKKEGQQVITHEQLHYRLFHSLDNLFMEVFKVFFWFNPLTYLFTKELRQTHEFEVDQIMAAGNRQNQYSDLLLKLSIPEHSVLINEFSSGELRGRLQMLFKSRSGRVKQFSYLPAVVLFVFFGSSIVLEPVQAGIDRAIKNDVVKIKKINSMKQHLVAELSMVKSSIDFQRIKNKLDPQKATKSINEDSMFVKKDQKSLQVIFAATDSVITDQKNNLLKLYGTAELSIGQTKIVADYIKYDHTTSTVYAKGIYRFDNTGKPNLYNSGGKPVLDSLVLNVKTRKAILYK